jgi:hypothetical protein
MSQKNITYVHTDPANLINKLELAVPLIGFYDSHFTSPFEPVIQPVRKGYNCIFSFYNDWLNGKTLHLTKQNFGCGGAGHWICGIEGRIRQGYLDFLVNTEGLKSSYEIMDKWLDAARSYKHESDRDAASLSDNLKTYLFLLR